MIVTTTPSLRDIPWRRHRRQDAGLGQRHAHG